MGCAINTTPRKETKAATCCERVKGSFTRTQHAAQATLGARKVITVASAIGKYRRESGIDETDLGLAGKGNTHSRIQRL